MGRKVLRFGKYSWHLFYFFKSSGYIPGNGLKFFGLDVVISSYKNKFDWIAFELHLGAYMIDSTIYKDK